MTRAQSWSAGQLQEAIDACPFNRFCGVQLVSADMEAQRLVLTMPMRAELAREADRAQFHGGVIAALADTAACYVLLMLLGRSGVGPTMNLRVDYLRPALDTALTASAVVRRAGRTASWVDIDIKSDGGRLIAIARGTFSTRATSTNGTST